MWDEMVSLVATISVVLHIVKVFLALLDAFSCGSFTFFLLILVVFALIELSSSYR